MVGIDGPISVYMNPTGVLDWWGSLVPDVRRQVRHLMAHLGLYGLAEFKSVGPDQIESYLFGVEESFGGIFPYPCNASLSHRIYVSEGRNEREEYYHFEVVFYINWQWNGIFQGKSVTLVSEVLKRPLIVETIDWKSEGF